MAQEGEGFIDRLSAQYSNAKRLHCKMQMVTSSDKHMVEIWQNDKIGKMITRERVVLVSQDLMVLVNETAKIIMLRPVYEEVDQSLIAGPVPLDSLRPYMKSVTFDSLPGEITIAHIQFEHPQLKSMDIEIGDDWGLKRLGYEFNNVSLVATGKMQIHFEQLEINPTFSLEEFALEQYVKKEGERYVPAADYSSYTLYEMDQNGNIKN